MKGANYLQFNAEVEFVSAPRRCAHETMQLFAALDCGKLFALSAAAVYHVCGKIIASQDV